MLLVVGGGSRLDFLQFGEMTHSFLTMHLLHDYLVSQHAFGFHISYYKAVGLSNRTLPLLLPLAVPILSYLQANEQQEINMILLLKLYNLDLHN